MFKKIKGNCEEQLSEQTCHPTVNWLLAKCRLSDGQQLAISQLTVLSSSVGQQVFFKELFFTITQIKLLSWREK